MSNTNWTIMLTDTERKEKHPLFHNEALKDAIKFDGNGTCIPIYVLPKFFTVITTSGKIITAYPERDTDTDAVFPLSWRAATGSVNGIHDYTQILAYAPIDLPENILDTLLAITKSKGSLKQSTLYSLLTKKP